MGRPGKDMADADIAQADGLWIEAEGSDPADHTAVYNFCKEADAKHGGQNVEIKWRLARACKDMSEMASVAKADAKKYAYEGKDRAAEAIALDPENWHAQMFMGCLFGVCSNFEMMNKLGSAKTMKQHFEKAVELCGDCPEPYHSLGQAEFGFADAGRAASMMGLKGSYQTAYDLFIKAESLCPHACYEREGGHYNTNLMMLVKACKALKKTDEAKEWAAKFEAAEVKTPDDRKAVEEFKKIKL